MIIAGEAGAREKRVRRMWSTTNGHSYDRIFWGPHGDVEALLMDSKSGLMLGALSHELQPVDGSPISILTIHYAGKPGAGGNDETTETVSISYSDETFPLNQNPTFINIGTDTIIDLEGKLNSHDANPYSDTSSVEYRYYNLRSKKVDNYRVKLPQVTWQRVVGSNYPTALDLAGVGGIWSTGNLAGSIGAPILFSIPTGNVGVSADDAATFTPGWLKGASVSFDGLGKAELVLTAEYGLWANDAYEFFGYS